MKSNTKYCLGLEIQKPSDLCRRGRGIDTLSNKDKDLERSNQGQVTSIILHL